MLSPGKLPPKRKIWKLALTDINPDRNRPTKRGIFWKLALTRKPDPIRLRGRGDLRVISPLTGGLSPRQQSLHWVPSVGRVMWSVHVADLLTDVWVVGQLGRAVTRGPWCPAMMYRIASWQQGTQDLQLLRPTASALHSPALHIHKGYVSSGSGWWNYSSNCVMLRKLADSCRTSVAAVSNNVLIKVTLSRQRHCRGTVQN